MLWRIEGVRDNALTLLHGRLRHIQASLDGHLESLSNIQLELDYLASSTTRALFSRQDLLAKKLAAWNDFMRVFFERLFGSILVASLTYLLHLIQLTILTRERDLADERRAKFDKQTAVPASPMLKTLTQLANSLFSPYISLPMSPSRPDPPSPEDASTVEKEMLLFLETADYLTANQGFTMLLELVTRTLVERPIAIDQTYSDIEFQELLDSLLDAILVRFEDTSTMK